jgi:hypothetical protein
MIWVTQVKMVSEYMVNKNGRTYMTKVLVIEPEQVICRVTDTEETVNFVENGGARQPITSKRQGNS